MNNRKAKKNNGKSKTAKMRGNKYVCGICGLSVVVDEDCCCEQACDLTCCGEQMTLC